MMDAKEKIILVIDDEPQTLDVIRQFLEPEGFLVVTLDRGGPAIELASKLSFDLLLLDVFLPSISARVLANKITVSQPMLKILFMTGYSSETVISHGILPAGAQVMQKPIARKDLISQVHACLASGTYWRQISQGSMAGTRALLIG